MKFFSYKNRPFHLGPFPLERLTRAKSCVDSSKIPEFKTLDFTNYPKESIVHAISRYLAMMDLVRDGEIAHKPAEIPDSLIERTNHLKATGYYFDASMVGVCELRPEHYLSKPIQNSAIDSIRVELEKGQPKTYAAGVDAVYADILASARTERGPVLHHKHAIVFLVEYTREPRSDEKGTDWFHNAQSARSALLTSNTAVVLANYIRMLGYEARAHSATFTDIDLNRVACDAGLCSPIYQNGEFQLVNPFVGERFGLACLTTTLELENDAPLGPNCGRSGWHSHGPSWWLGKGTARKSGTAIPFSNREFRMGEYPFETIKRVEDPTTFIDEERVPRFPKRADFFARALFGDMGKQVQDSAKNAYYVMKSPIGACARRAIGALLLLQFGEARGPISSSVKDPEKNAENLKGASYFLATDAVGLSRVPDWAYYSHDAGGNELIPYHDNAISMLFDQGHETMEGASGDDWISVSQSMRAYLRFSLIGGVIAEQVRRLGYSARVHTVIDSEVLQPPMLLLSGLGEVSRIGEVILNPYLGPRLKAGTVTTSMPMQHDKPIDFGLQHFCNSCNKCARECPAGAITAGPKLMYNGYEIWKSDAEKCARYRLTNSAGGMCGRCMKTCPWNLEGLFTDSAFRYMAINFPKTAKTLAKLDDKLNRGTINPIKKWWWDIELNEESNRYIQANATNTRELQKEFNLKYEDQTLAVYPADKMPPPYPVTFPINREEGIKNYRSLLTPKQYQDQIKNGKTYNLVLPAKIPTGPPPVFPVIVSERIDLSDQITLFELVKPNGDPLPEFSAGSHIDVVIAPEYQREYSLAGNPADQSKYLLGLQCEPAGRGGSLLMHKIFRKNRTIMISEPRNHFPLDENVELTILMAGGIGITPLITMAHRLHAISKEFVFHISARSPSQFGFEKLICKMPWYNNTKFHYSSEGCRADFDILIPNYLPGMKIYCCGSEKYMEAIFDNALAKNWPECALAREYFSVPEPPEYENKPFKIKLSKSNQIIEIDENTKITDALASKGIFIDTKCTDGICGVCAVPYSEGEIEHRDYVLSKKERTEKIILCCSRAKEEDGMIELSI